MRKFIPLIEALGLIFALVSWWLSWTSVQQWNDRINAFVESIEIHQRLYDGRHLSNLIEYEASVSRASRNFKLTGATTTFDYEYAWQFAAARISWTIWSMSESVIVIHWYQLCVNKTAQFRSGDTACQTNIFSDLRH